MTPTSATYACYGPTLHKYICLHDCINNIVVHKKQHCIGNHANHINCKASSDVVLCLPLGPIL